MPAPIDKPPADRGPQGPAERAEAAALRAEAAAVRAEASAARAEEPAPGLLDLLAEREGWTSHENPDGSISWRPLD